MKIRLFTIFAMFSLILNGSELSSNHNHHKIWKGVALIGIAGGTAILTNYLINRNTPIYTTTLAPKVGEVTRVFVSTPVPSLMFNPIIPTTLPTTTQSVQTLCSMGFCK